MGKQPLEIQRHLVASLAHISTNDAKLLAEDGVIVIHDYEEGFCIHVNGVEDSFLRGFGYSESFLRLMSLARENACDYLTIDRDGPEIDGLETFSR
jgi:hypothetical protein